MRKWHLTAADPMAPRLSADARSGRTNYTDDQTWQVRLGQPAEPAISLETRYGGRVGLARIVPIWTVDRRQIYETQGYHTPPVITAFAPDYVRISARLTVATAVTLDIWVMESQAIGGQFTLESSGSQPETIQCGLTAQAAREQQPMQMFFLTLENGLTALQMGRLKYLQPVLLLEGASDTAMKARLSRPVTVEPGAPVRVRWAAAGLPERDASLGMAYKWLSDPGWDAQFQAIQARAEAAPQIETGHPDWDAALAWSQQMILRSFLGSTGQLPHPSFVSSRKTAQGYPASGVHSGGFGVPWGGQTVTEALGIAVPVALAAPDLAKGMVRNFLAVQHGDGWIDARPGLGGQRTNVIAPPLLATLAYTVYQITRDEAFLAEVFDGLRAFFARWFKPDLDHNGDGLPEWRDPGQGAFADSPTFAQNRRWAQGIDLTTVQAPDLAAYLIREAGTLIHMAETLGRDHDARDLTPRYEALQAKLDEMWDAGKGAFHYRDRDTHTCPTGERLFEIKGDQSLSEHTTLPQASRLILRVSGGLSRKPNMSATIEGITADGKSTHETINGGAFSWYMGIGTATTNTVWRTITHLKFDGLSRVFKVEGHTVDLSRHDMALLMPLWAGTLSDDQVERTVARLTDPDQYWAEYGIRGCPKSDPAYDPLHRNGCGGMWPDWNARLGWALIALGRHAESAELFKRVLAAQIKSLKEMQGFRAFYDPETGAGLGDSDVLEGIPSVGWFARLFGAYAPDAATVIVTGPFALPGETIRWTQHGVIIERSADHTAITFASGKTVTLKPDSGPQTVRDPKAMRAKRRKPPAAITPPPPSDPPPAAHPDEGLLPDGT